MTGDPVIDGPVVRSHWRAVGALAEAARLDAEVSAQLDLTQSDEDTADHERRERDQLRERFGIR